MGAGDDVERPRGRPVLVEQVLLDAGRHLHLAHELVPLLARRAEEEPPRPAQAAQGQDDGQERRDERPVEGEPAPSSATSTGVSHWRSHTQAASSRTNTGHRWVSAL